MSETTTSAPATVTPMSGTESLSTRRRSERERQRADQHREQQLEQAVAVPEPACIEPRTCSAPSARRRTLTVSTNRVSAAIAPTIAARALSRSTGYCQKDGTFHALSGHALSSPSTTPTTAPISGSTQRLPVKYCRRRNECSRTGVASRGVPRPPTAEPSRPARARRRRSGRRNGSVRWSRKLRELDERDDEQDGAEPDERVANAAGRKCVLIQRGRAPSRGTPSFGRTCRRSPHRRALGKRLVAHGGPVVAHARARAAGTAACTSGRAARSGSSRGSSRATRRRQRGKAGRKRRSAIAIACAFVAVYAANHASNVDESKFRSSNASSPRLAPVSAAPTPSRGRHAILCSTSPPIPDHAAINATTESRTAS